MRLRREPRSRRRREPVGVVLAGGLGLRIGGSKAIVELNRRPLISYPLESLWRALGNVAIVAKIDTELPSLAGVTIWIEPEHPRHPLTGILHALAVAEGRPVVVCAADLPFVTPDLIGRLADANPRGAPAILVSSAGRLQPLLGCYQPVALELLAGFHSRPELPLRDSVAAIGPATYEVDDPDVLFNVNTPDDLLQAAAMLDRKKAATRR
jgi:molybdopterin-guanine dinucleotide biosynthesis protein A